MAAVDDLAAKIEADMLANYGGEENVSTDPASGIRGRVYMKAMAIARLQLSSVVAGNQYDPQQVTDLIGKLEWEYKVYPNPSDDLPTRRAAVAAAAKVTGGSRRANVEAVLRSLLGVDFVAYLTFPKQSVVNAADPATVGNWVLPGTPAFVGKVTENVLPGTRTVAFTKLGGRMAALQAGDTMLIDPGYTRPEKVTVTAATPTTFTAVFAKCHAIGAVFTTGRAPNLPSTKRQNLIVLTTRAARDAETRRKVHRILGKLLRGTSTWNIVEFSGGQAGPFKIGQSLLGVTALGAFSVSTGTVTGPAAASSSPSINAGATSRVAASALSSAPAITVGAIGIAAGTQQPSQASSAPTINVGATGRTASSVASSSPSISVGATGQPAASLPSSAPNISVGAVGKSAFAGAPSTAPSISVAATAKNAAANPSSSPTPNNAARSAAVKAAAPSSAPTINGAATGTKTP